MANRWDQLRNSAKAIKAKVTTKMDGVVREVFALAGAASIVYGVYLMHRPSAFLVAGAFCIIIAWGRSQ